MDQYGSDSDVDSDEASSTGRKLSQIENEQPFKVCQFLKKTFFRKSKTFEVVYIDILQGNSETKDRQSMERKGREDTTSDQTNRLYLQRDNTKRDAHGKLPSDTLGKNPTDGTKVDKDISGKLLHGKLSQPSR